MFYVMQVSSTILPTIISDIFISGKESHIEVQNLKTMEIEYIRDFGNGEWANEEGHVTEYFERNGLTLELDEEGKPIASRTGTGWGDYNKVREVLDNIYAKPEPEIEEPEPPTHHRGGWDLSR